MPRTTAGLTEGLGMSLLHSALPEFLGGLGAALVFASGEWVMKRVKYRNNDRSSTADEPWDENTAER